MSKFLNKMAIGAALFVAVAVLLSLPTGNRKGTIAQAAITDCPISFVQSGSTTVAEYSDLTESPFEQTGGRTGPNDHLHWGPGTNITLIETGSNDGMKDLDALSTLVSPISGAAAAVHAGGAQGGQMSRKPVNSGSTSGGEGAVQATTDLKVPGVFGAMGSETAYNYWWNVANDAFAIVVSTDPSMNPIFNNGLSINDLITIWTADGQSGRPSIKTLQWNQLPSVVLRGLTGVFPSTVITPAFRTASGGSYSDFNSKVIGLSSPFSLEEATYELLWNNDGGTHRNLTSSLMADQAQTAGVIAYTSLSQLASHPNARVIPIAANNTSFPGIIADDTNIPSLPGGLQRLLFVGTHDATTVSRVDNPTQVRTDDWINLARSTQGHAIFADAGYPVIPPADVDAIPDYDVDLSGHVTLGDLLMVAQRWGATSACIGWIRNDVNNDGWVSLTDIGQVINHWSAAGLICDNASDAVPPSTGHNCYRDPAQKPQ